MQERLRAAVSEAERQGASYAEVRLVRRRDEPIAIKNGQITHLSSSDGVGFGVRVLVDGAWGFSASAHMNDEQFRITAGEAVEIARASAQVSPRPVELAPQEPVCDTYRTPCLTDPRTVAAEDRIDLLLELDSIMRRPAEIRVAAAALNFRYEEKTFLNSDGSFIQQQFTETGASLSATAVSRGEVQTRSFRDQARAGYEQIERWGLRDRARCLADEAVDLLWADSCPSAETDLVLGSSQLALQVHESCGHPIELDRVYGSEASFAGTSFLTPDKQGSFRYGSPAVNITADATVPGGLGTFGYDDEGVPAQRVDIVRDGIFVDYITDRESAATVNQRSNGCMLADGWHSIPMVRMTNINLEPGDWTLEEIIADTERGIYMDGSKSWSLDDRRLNFHFATEIAWEIRDGKLTRMLKDAAYTGMTPEFWRGCNAVAGEDEWQVWGLPSCAKGEPVQIAHVGHGAAPARFSSVKVGGDR